MYLNYLRGGSGLGDPLERDPEKVLSDIHDGYVLPRHAEDAYAVVVEKIDDGARHNSAVQGEWDVDEEATEELRAERMRERAEKAQPVSEWYEGERERIQNEEGLIDDVKKTYVSSMRMSKRFTEFYHDFWELPDDFEFTLSKQAQRSLDNRFDSGLRPMWDNFTLRHKTWLDVEDEPYVPYTWTNRSIQDLPGPDSTFRDG
jgi:acetone carboxylase alpha subunit